MTEHSRPTGYVVSVTIDGGVELYDVAIPTAAEAELAVGKYLQLSRPTSGERDRAPCQPPLLQRSCLRRDRLDEDDIETTNSAPPRSRRGPVPCAIRGTAGTKTG